MKKLRLITLIMALSMIVACNFTEELYVNDDGSGKLSISFDGSELMKQLPESSSDSVPEKPIDTLLVFKDLLEEKRDSIALLPAEEQEKLRKLEPFSMRMAMDPEKKEMRFNMFSEFKNINEINDAFNAFQSAASVGPQPGGGAAKASPKKTPEPGTEVDYTFKGNTFTRTTTIVDQELFQQSVDSLAGAEMFLSSSTYTFRYHFPRKVKNVNVEGATFSLDGKTMTYEVNFLDMMKSPEAVNLKVELED